MSSNNKRASLGPGTSGRQEPKPQQTEDADNDNFDYEDDEEGGTRIGNIYIPPPVEPYCSTESKGPRLIISQIENENFKSYAGKVILGPFHQCFTAIIGPNGSGKSNVIDSMLFVFGYRANKIRCKKLSVLLHNSAKFPNIQMCSVGVHFKQIVDKPDGTFEEVPKSEIVVARVAFKDNSSYYTINGRKAQYKDVSKLLKQHGVDLDHNRFLILQGEVESIAMMKAKGPTENECGMLEYLEDIVGTTRYIKPLAQINNEVEKLTDERTEKHNRCKLAEREMKDLEKPFNDAIEFLQLENSLTRTKNLKLQKYLSEHKRKLIECSSQREEIASELKEHDEKCDVFKKERLEKEKLIKDELSKFNKLCKDKEDMEQKLKQCLHSFTELQATMTATNKRRKQNKEQLKKQRDKIDELKKLPDKNEAEIKECENSLEKLVKQKTKLEEELQENYTLLEEKTKPLREEREALESQLIDLKKDADMANGELAFAESELKLLKHDEVAEQRKYETMKTSYEESKRGYEEKMSKIQEYQSLVPELKKEIIVKTKQIQENKAEEESLRNKLFSIKAEISEKTSNMKMAQSNNKVLDSLMRQKMEGNIPGILGRLGDLGGIDSKYDVAISTACGRLDNIIVDTVNTAQRCIEHLKTYDIGRASFIALEKVQHLQRFCNKQFNTPENVPRLFDLIKVEDERVLPAFYFALRNTLVATDLEQGTRIAYGATRFRVVTLHGDVIETSGTMSGGGRTQMRGKMGQKVTTKTKQSANTSLISQKDIEELQVQAQEMQSRINALQENQGKLERDINHLKNSLHQKEAEINKMNITVSSLAEQLPRIEEQLKNQKERMENVHTDPKKVAEMEKEIENKRQAHQKFQKKVDKLTAQISDISKKITDIHGEKIKAVQKKIDATTKKINGLNGNINKLRVEIKTAERTMKKVEKEIEDLTKDIENSEESIKKLHEERTQADNDSVEWTKKIEEAKEVIENSNKGSKDIQKEIIALCKKEEEGQIKKLEIEEKLQAADKKIADIKSLIPQCEKELRPLKLHEIPLAETPEEPLKTYTEEELNAHKLQDIQYQYSVQEEKLNSKKPNLSVIQEFLNKRDVYLDRVKVLEDITTKRNEMRKLYDDVRKKRYTEFMQGFHIIARKLKQIYQMITQGGDAELELVDSMDPFSEGVSFSVRPPKKSWKNISNLSGGEKTLSSLALVFALHYYKPSPLYFMDEIDAALDFKNISIVAHYIKERTKNAQFIIISLRSNMFELSDYLVGIYKVNDCTNSITIRNQVPDFADKSNNIASSQASTASAISNDKQPSLPECTTIEAATCGGTIQPLLSASTMQQQDIEQG